MLIQMVKEGLLLSTDILTVDAGLFQQILAPEIGEDQYEKRLERARDHAIGYAVTPIYKGTTIWIVVLEDDRFWRWAVCTGEYYDAFIEEHEWLADLPQLFLVGETTTKVVHETGD